LAKGVLKWIIYAVAAGLIFLGVIFMISTNLGFQYFLEGAVFIGVAVAILYFSREKKPLEIRQTVNLAGPIKVKEMECPTCSAILNPDTVEVIDGKPYMTCDYCGNKFEMTEEPTW
jgi:DNA-directed RNA polymerase subunit RPC12/RpoP